MKIITWGDIRRGTLAIVLVIIPTVLLGTYIGPALQSFNYRSGLWQLKAQCSHEVIEPLHVLRLKPFFFKFRLMNEVESRIDNPELFNKYKNKIERQLKRFPFLCGIYFSCHLSVILFCFMVHNKKMVSKGKV
ncbi:MAG: hypothetical protein Ct9H300mP28_26870 [Pseudomonadota bacterium]|nr:MAG: hypothetical protein Ct9H300mP28_26870 [Pseudomonadota bacterium]